MDEIYDLEQKIMNVWQTKDDLETLSKRYFAGKTPMTEDELANFIIGLAEIHDARCQELFNFYESNFTSLSECL